MTIHAIYENGVFRPTEPVELPEKTPVEIHVAQENDLDRAKRLEIMEVLSRSHQTGQTDTAARHNEHQP